MSSPSVRLNDVRYHASGYWVGLVLLALLAGTWYGLSHTCGTVTDDHALSLYPLPLKVFPVCPVGVTVVNFQLVSSVEERFISGFVGFTYPPQFPEGEPPTHWPAAHTSPVVQALPSSHVRVIAA